MYASLWSQPGIWFGQFERLRRELDDVFGTPGLPSSIRSAAAGTLPPVNVGRTPDKVEVYLFAPGLDPAKIDVTVERGVLRLAGERVADLPQEDARINVYSRERSAGRFLRAIALPDDVDTSQVDARYRDGVLQVSLARQQAAQPQRINVQ
ncbi:Hsp20/alpha crystallin family protein [Roseateles violae]|uniref:Hsp20/alpha crystallin family protein n=1 Tax=Roseateles violae TaxID=3058042 RepID=A0ABT8DWW6_9BURK|nr:Hsp20/alpha crystallin family protein [Pelomonas sp. PFR6]MDN3922608.1 Hsp20/alpha crystallin family protein [Pelomonas sp. PFR6]